MNYRHCILAGVIAGMLAVIVWTVGEFLWLWTMLGESVPEGVPVAFSLGFDHTVGWSVLPPFVVGSPIGFWLMHRQEKRRLAERAR